MEISGYPLAHITLKISDDHQATIDLYPGDEIEGIVDNFCSKYHLNEEIKMAIQMELKAQLMEQDIDLTHFEQPNISSLVG